MVWRGGGGWDIRRRHGDGVGRRRGRAQLRRLDERLGLGGRDVGMHVGPGARRRPRHKEFHRHDAEKDARQQAEQREEKLGLSSHGRPEMEKGATRAADHGCAGYAGQSRSASRAVPA
jgi:hypothetical protein